MEINLFRVWMSEDSSILRLACLTFTGQPVLPYSAVNKICVFKKLTIDSYEIESDQGLYKWGDVWCAQRYLKF